MERMIASAPYVWLPFVLMAVLPAICEELAFRGFILSGLRHLGHKWWAIGLSAVFFGMAHTVVQQSLAAAALGLVIGYVAVQTDSLVPASCSTPVTTASCWDSRSRRSGSNQLAERWPTLASLVVEPQEGGLTYRMPVVIVAGLLVARRSWPGSIACRTRPRRKKSSATPGHCSRNNCWAAE